MVLDPNLAEHLAHFGIDMLKMQKVRGGLWFSIGPEEEGATLRCLSCIPAFCGCVEPFLVNRPSLSDRQRVVLSVFLSCPSGLFPWCSVSVLWAGRCPGSLWIRSL